MAPVISIRKVQKGEPCGYGGIWSPEEESYLGILAIGYGDGLARELPVGTHVLIKGTLYRIVTRVAMDLLGIALGGTAVVAVGDWAVIWGEEPEIQVERTAERMGSSVYSLVTHLNHRIERVLVE
eukprot:Blabericola_migrator_1__7329@NODE_3729_length_1551_cov_3_264825_g2316_i0_p3_GENE_NODE_3729_length_1551_cov_3_264825_g2316_i0NODE_3729_length_1551_cov_3_264825_g2316_i0_p3_ORF_typecomplete_len125_score6_14Ala_racemase_C/PF00842_21/6_4e31DUF4267/PF14087_6/0_093_NODE_3729_length_1551_cov_3_264825_g2316_i011401514